MRSIVWNLGRKSSVPLRFTQDDTAVAAKKLLLCCTKKGRTLYVLPDEGIYIPGRKSFEGVIGGTFSKVPPKKRVLFSKKSPENRVLSDVRRSRLL